MEFKFVKDEVKKENLVYMKEGVFILMAKMNEKVYAPNFSFLCVPVAEFNTIKQLADTVKVTGTARVTGTGRAAKDGGNEIYKIALITLDNGTLIDVSFADVNHPLYGLSFKWIEQVTGAAQFTSDANYVYFPPNGSASFDLGFKRERVKVADSHYDQATKKWVGDYTNSKETFITVTNLANSDGFLRAYKGMKLLEQAIEFAGQHMTPVTPGVDQDALKSVIGNIPF